MVSLFPIDIALSDYGRISCNNYITLSKPFCNDATCTNYRILTDCNAFANDYFPSNPDMFSNIDVFLVVDSFALLIDYTMPVCRRNINLFDSRQLSSISIPESSFTHSFVFASGRALMITPSFTTIFPPVP